MFYRGQGWTFQYPKCLMPVRYNHCHYILCNLRIAFLVKCFYYVHYEVTVKYARACVYYRFHGDGGRGATMHFPARHSADAVTHSASQSPSSDGHVAHLPLYTDHSTRYHRRYRSVENERFFCYFVL